MVRICFDSVLNKKEPPPREGLVQIWLPTTRKTRTSWAVAHPPVVVASAAKVQTMISEDCENLHMLPRAMPKYAISHNAGSVFFLAVYG